MGKVSVSLSGNRVTLSVLAAIAATASLAHEEYPTGEKVRCEPTKEGGRVSYKNVTEPRMVLKFQTAEGAAARGRGSFTVPLEDSAIALATLADIDIDNLETESEEEWLSVEESIRQTIRRFVSEDDDQEYIGFRTRLGKGSKEVRIPVNDWPGFVSETLPSLVKVGNEKLAELEAARVARAARDKKEKK